MKNFLQLAVKLGEAEYSSKCDLTHSYEHLTGTKMSKMKV